MRCPFALWVPSPNFGYPRGAAGQNHPIAIVDHVMQGYLSGCDSWFRNPDSWSSAHFGIGKGGAIHQYVDTNDAAWANGAVNRPSSLGAALAVLGNPNVLTVSIEHEDFSGEVWTEAMYDADLRLKAWLLEVGIIPGPFGPWALLGHSDIDSVDRAGCPGPTWPKERLLLDLIGQEEEMKAIVVRHEGLGRDFWLLPGRLVHVVSGEEEVLREAEIKVVAPDSLIWRLPVEYPDGLP